MVTFVVQFLFLACLWDTDTVKDELHGVPQTEALIRGRWYRHSPELYRYRVDSLTSKLASQELSLSQFDDLAVAYERLRRRDEALAVLEAKRERLKKEPDPEHQYRYHANRGTILAHDGRLEEGIIELEKAIAINPDAHFGRERYQILLLKYIHSTKSDKQLWVRENFLSNADFWFWERAVTNGLSFTSEGPRREELKTEDAREAIMGMIRFGGLEGPELYRALGDVELVDGNIHTAWWMYRYAIHMDHPAKAQISKSLSAIETHWQSSWYGNYALPTEATFERIYIDGQKWLDTFQKLELESLERGEDPTDESILREILRITDQSIPERNLYQGGFWRSGPFLLVLVALILWLGQKKMRASGLLGLDNP